MIKNKYLAFVLFVLLVLVFWNLLDWLFTAFITHGSYRLGGGDIFIPLVVAAVIGSTTILRGGKR
ncbi:MAG: hypothetical protein IKD93_01575 [Firmicutes bacterium]|nr:hypothetical protein [Bacillota bacterium]